MAQALAMDLRLGLEGREKTCHSGNDSPNTRMWLGKLYLGRGAFAFLLLYLFVLLLNAAYEASNFMRQAIRVADTASFEGRSPSRER